MNVDNIPPDHHLFAANVNETMVPVHVKNCFENYARIKREFGKRTFMVPDGKEAGRAIIVGSGSSLDESYEQLREFQRRDLGIIICSCSQISTLYYHGIKPEVCVVFDAKTTVDLFDIEEIDYEHTTLLVHPGIPPAVFKRWKGPVYIFRLHAGNDFNQFLPYAYDFIPLQSMPFATALATQMIFAAYMGFGPIFMVGLDMQGPRFLRKYYKNGEWHDFDWRHEEDHKNVIEDGEFKTSQALIYHKKGLLSAVRIDLLHGGYPLFNCSDKSIIREIPYCSLDDLLADPESWRKKDWTVQKKMDKIDRFLTKRWTHVISVHNGISWVSQVIVGGSDEELTGKMHQVNRDVLDYKTKRINDAKRAGKPLSEIAPDFHPRDIVLIDIPKHWSRVKALQNGAA